MPTNKPTPSKNVSVKHFTLQHMLPLNISIEAHPAAYDPIFTQKGERDVQISLQSATPKKISKDLTHFALSTRIICHNTKHAQALYLGEITVLGIFQHQDIVQSTYTSADTENMSQQLFAPLNDFLARALLLIHQAPPLPSTFPAQSGAAMSAQKSKQPIKKPPRKVAVPKTKSKPKV